MKKPIGLMACLLFASLAGAQEMPNLLLTPGKTNPALTKRVLCSPSFRTGAYRQVSDVTKRKTCIAYKIPPSKCTGKTYEVDHLISLELGGSNEPENLWPEPYRPRPGAREKDVVESWLHRQVCAGNMTLEQAQDAIVNDWYRIYQRIEKWRKHASGE